MWYIEVDYYLLKPLIKVFIKAGALSDLGGTVDYPKKLFRGSTFQAAGSTKFAPPVS